MSSAPGAEETRVPLRKPCTLHYPGGTLQAETFNVSTSGLGVVLPDRSQWFNPAAIRSVTVRGIGVFEVSVRWHRGNRVGLRFRSKSGPPPELDTYL